MSNTSAFLSIDPITHSITVAPALSASQLVLYLDDNAYDPVTGAYLGTQYVLHILGSTESLRFALDAIQEIVFGDGTVWSAPSFYDNAAPYLPAAPGQSWMDDGYGPNSSYLLGAAGDQFIQGNNGNDTLDGGQGNDTLDGGAGSDTYVLAAGGGSDQVFDWNEAGEINRIVVSPTIGANQVAFFFDDGYGSDPYRPPSFVLRLLGSHDEMRFALDAIQEIVFGDGTVWSAPSFYDNAAPYLPAAPGQSWMDDGYGPNSSYLLGAAGDQFIQSNNGNDTLDGGQGNDTLDGGAGSDTYVLAAGGGSDQVFDWNEAGEINRIVVSPTIGANQVAFFFDDGYGSDPYRPPSFVLRLLGSHDEMRFALDAIQEIVFGDGTVWSAPSFYDNAAPYLPAAPGQSWMDDGYGPNSSYLLGAAGDQFIQGNNGNDTLDGGQGNDTLDGGAGSDTYVLAAGGGSDQVFDWNEAGEINRIVVSPTIPTNGVELFRLDNAIDPATGNFIGMQFVLRLLGSNDEIRFFPGSVQEISFGDGSVWNELAITQLAVSKSNDAPTGEVTISGWVEQGQTLMASNTLHDADGMGAVSYQWLADDLEIHGANAETYVLTANELGKRISVLAQYTDSYGTHEIVSSATTEAVHPTNLNWIGTNGANAFVGSLGDDTLNGLAGRDTLIGQSGDDVLIGGAGADQLDGGEGSDIYLVWSSTEHFTGEFSDTGTQGFDEIRFDASEVSTLMLFANDTGIESVVLGTGLLAEADTTGTVALKANALRVLNGLSMTGNAGDNVLIGTAFDDTINGGLGVDSMNGGAGDDTYWVDDASDRVIETSPSGGLDTVVARVAFQLGANVENLTLIGDAAINGYGNALGNVLQGNERANILVGYAGNDTLSGGAGNDRLLGGLGNDVLTGGLGNDIFRFNQVATTTNADVITDFGTGLDKIQLENAVFTRLTSTGVLSSAYFVSNAGGVAMDADDYVVYDTSTGRLSYDADGNGNGAAMEIVTLLGVPALTASLCMVS